MKLVIFDLDHTLVDCNTAFEFGKYLYHERFVSLPLALALISAYFFYFIGILSSKKLHSIYHRHLIEKIPSDTLCSLTELFFEKKLSSMINSIMMQELKKAKDAGYPLVLLSSSPFFLVAQVAAKLGISESAGTVYEKDGTISAIDGKQKASFVKEKAAQHHIELSNVIAYTDSISDLPLLKLVGSPIVVSPDIRLKIYSFFRSWPLIDKRGRHLHTTPSEK